MDQLLNTKLFIPPLRPNLVPRPRLIEELNAAASSRLTVISAPAGYGKTTLINSWTRQLDIPVCWISLDAGDNELAIFLRYFITALSNLKEGFGIEVIDALKSPQPPQTEILLTILINEISGIGERFVLVLDDSHLIDAQNVVDAISYIVENQPPGMHMVISGRLVLPLESTPGAISKNGKPESRISFGCS